MIATSTSASTTHVFDPAAWLQAFGLVGGGYSMTDRLSLMYQVAGRSPEDQQAACHMIDCLTVDDRAALFAHIERRHAGQEG